MAPDLPPDLPDLASAARRLPGKIKVRRKEKHYVRAGIYHNAGFRRAARACVEGVDRSQAHGALVGPRAFTTPVCEMGVRGRAVLIASSCAALKVSNILSRVSIAKS